MLWFHRGVTPNSIILREVNLEAKPYKVIIMHHAKPKYKKTRQSYYDIVMTTTA
jgi:hypothetical protein